MERLSSLEGVILVSRWLLWWKSTTSMLQWCILNLGAVSTYLFSVSFTSLPISVACYAPVPMFVVRVYSSMDPLISGDFIRLWTSGTLVLFLEIMESEMLLILRISFILSRKSYFFDWRDLRYPPILPFFLIRQISSSF